MNIKFVLLVFSFVLFVVAAIPLTEPYHARLVAAGLACLAGSMIFG